MTTYDPFHAADRKRKKAAVRPGEPGWSSNTAPLPGPGEPIPAAPAAPQRKRAPYGSFRGMLEDEVDTIKDLPNQIGQGLRDFKSSPLETTARALAPLGPEAGAGLYAINGLRQAGNVAQGARAAKANPFLANTVRSVVNSKAIQAGARVVKEAPGRLASIGRGLRDGAIGLAGIGAANAALPYVEKSAQQGRAYADGVPLDIKYEGDKPAAPPTGLREAAPTDNINRPGGPVAFENPPSPDAMRTMQVGRDANGNLVATNKGDFKDIGGRTGLRERQFAPETARDVARAKAASELLFKNIGGGLDVQQAALSQALAGEAGGGVAGVAGAGGLRRGSGGADGGPDFGDMIDLEKLKFDAEKFGIERGDKKEEAGRKEAEGLRTEDRTRADARSNQYLARIPEEKQKPNDFSDAQLLAQIDRLQEGDADLANGDEEALRPVRENLLQRANELISSKSKRWTTDDPNEAAPIDAGDANLGRVGKGSYRGGLQAFVPDSINDFGGSFTYEGSNGETYYANADEFNPVELELLSRAARLGAKDKGRKKSEK